MTSRFQRYRPESPPGTQPVPGDLAAAAAHEPGLRGWLRWLRDPAGWSAGHYRRQNKLYLSATMPGTWRRDTGPAAGTPSRTTEEEPR